MTADELAHLFEKFYRTGAARETASGTGLGLALTRLVVEAHGGAIKAESEGPGQGSAFNFWLPAVAGKANGTDGAAGSARLPLTAGVW
jgi:signal transduction histidine kinase